MTDVEKHAEDELLFATGELVGEDDRLLREAAEQIARGESVDLQALRARPTLSEDDLTGIGELAAPLDDDFMGSLTSALSDQVSAGEAREPSAASGATAGGTTPMDTEGAQVVSLAARRSRAGWVAGSLSAAAAVALLWWTGGDDVDAPADGGLYRLELANAPASVRGADGEKRPGPAVPLKLATDANAQWILRPGRAVSSSVSFSAELIEEGAARELGAPCVSHEASSSGVVRVDLRLGACDWASSGDERELRFSVSLSQGEGAAGPAQTFPVRLTLVQSP